MFTNVKSLRGGGDGVPRALKIVSTVIYDNCEPSFAIYFVSILSSILASKVRANAIIHHFCTWHSTHMFVSFEIVTGMS